MKSDEPLREHLLQLLNGGHAHLDFDKTIANFPEELRGKTISKLPYTAWQLLEHMRIAQWDILEFSRDPKHVSPNWPEGYWPQSKTPPSRTAWNTSVKSFRQDLQAMKELVTNPDTDLFTPIPHGTGQTILREA